MLSIPHLTTSLQYIQKRTIVYEGASVVPPQHMTVLLCVSAASSCKVRYKNTTSWGKGTWVTQSLFSPCAILLVGGCLALSLSLAACRSFCRAFVSLSCPTTRNDFPWFERAVPCHSPSGAGSSVASFQFGYFATRDEQVRRRPYENATQRSAGVQPWWTTRKESQRVRSMTTYKVLKAQKVGYVTSHKHTKRERWFRPPHANSLGGEIEYYAENRNTDTTNGIVAIIYTVLFSCEVSLKPCS